MVKPHLVRSLAVQLTLWGLTGLCQAQTSGTGSISGTVVDEAGQPVGLAFVSITRFPASAGAGPASVGFTTAADGKFSFTALVAATYSACVFAAPQRGYLDTCEWRTQTDFKLAAGANVSGATLKLVKGAQVLFQVKDPQGLIAPGGAVPVAHFGVTSDIGSHHYARYYYNQGGQHLYILNVAFQRQMTLRVVPVKASVTDSGGNPVSLSSATATSLTSFTLPVGSPPKTIQLTVSSLLPGH